jgi:chromosome partitioning protein
MGMILAIANQKGGVGKTTIAVHLAVGLAKRGKSVIVVDADPQGNASSWFTDGDTETCGLFKALVVDEPIGMCVRPISRWDVGLLPGNSRTDEAMRFLTAVGRLESIPGKIRPLAGVADVVIIDMPPSRSAGFQELLLAADHLIVPTQLERLSLEGVGLMAQTVNDLSNRGGRLRLLAVVPNMVRINTTEHRDQLRALVEQFGALVWPPIPLSITVTEVCSTGRTLFDAGGKDQVSAQMNLLIDRCIENLWGGDDGTR